MKPSNSLLRSLMLGIAIILGIIIYAYGFQVTQVSLDEINSPRRQESLTRVLRALARPDILEYNQQETTVTAPIYVPCPTGSLNLPSVDKSGAYLVITPPCADPRADVTVEGFGFEPNTEGPLSFIPTSDVSLNLGNFKTDSQGQFTLIVKLPPRPDEAVQYIRAITRKNLGRPHLTQTAYDTWDKIIETVFLALLATSFGVVLAIPISFFAARNLMKDITSTMSKLALSILAWPTGIWIGGQVAGWIGKQSQRLTGNIWLTFLSILISSGLVWIIVRWALPQEEVRPAQQAVRILRSFLLLVASLISILILYLIARLATVWGLDLANRLGPASFLGNFLANLGEILNLIIAFITALMGGGLLSSVVGRFGNLLIGHLPPLGKTIFTLVLSVLAGSVLAALIGMGVNWLYQIDNPTTYLLWPAVIGAVIGLVAALATRNLDVIPIGLAIYYITRTILNALRAIEALIMAIVFVVWVGIGPFAGVLALSLHTIAALSKLYSEQVESILPGPLEAVKASGATRLQSIVYAVIPQIVPPYISFTMYRWDINVRMSTIIGFAGGGGIGFLLIQNINLLNYRAASAQMLAIAIVVALMDFLSSYIRERVV